MERFRKAVEAADADAMVASLAENIVFRSPVVFKPYSGREQVGTLLRAAMRVLKDFTYVDALRSSSQTALEFKANIGGREVHGMDLGTVDANGLLTQLTVFVRPFTAAHALAEAMREELKG